MRNLFFCVATWIVDAMFVIASKVLGLKKRESGGSNISINEDSGYFEEGSFDDVVDTETFERSEEKD